MKTQANRNSAKHAIMVASWLVLMLSAACTDKVQVVPDGSCGQGTSVYDLYAVGTVHTSFDCNAARLFTVTLQPHVENDYIGFCRLWFELEKDWDIYRSNYVEFHPGDNTAQQLEWGGSLPTGTYEMNATMKNIQFSSSCPESVHWEHQLLLGEIHITEFTNPQKVMQIEYFCQDSDIDTIDRYDVFLSPNTEEYIDIAFNIANTTYDVDIYDTNLTPQIIEYEPYQARRIKDYIFALKHFDDEMFLCGIKAFKDAAGNLLPDRLGATCEDNWVTRAPNCSTGSLIAVKSCIDCAASDEYRIDYNDLVTAMTIHELGLQRGAVEDEHNSTWPYPKFCIGHEALIVFLQEEGKHPYWAVRYSNPHFCDVCITGIKNISW